MEQVRFRIFMSVYNSLADFIGALCKFIRRQLGEEHRDRLRREGNCNAFIRDPTAAKSMYDAVQAAHTKTLSACFVLSTATSKAHPTYSSAI